MGKQIKDICRVISGCINRGELTKQQGKTLIGQAKHGDCDGALKGLEGFFKQWLTQ